MEEVIDLLGGHRFDDEATKIYKVPVNELETVQMINNGTGNIETHIDFRAQSFIDVVIGFITHHKERQLPRLKQLKRYSLADNNIKYRPKKSDTRADNRIASDFAKFIVSFKRGVLVGNPIEYNGDEVITQKVEDFSTRVNEAYHNQLMADDVFTYGWGFELVDRNVNGEEVVNKLDVFETFVIYDTSVDRNSVCGVRYYPIEFKGKTKTIVELYANDGFLYVLESEGDDVSKIAIQEDQVRQTYFNSVQINEWINNEDRRGDFEPVLDNIDAYDLSQSEMANFQQDMSEALLVLEGNPDTFKKEDGSLDKDAIDYSLRARMLIMGDKKRYPEGQTGTDPKAYYLKKEYDTTGVEAYNDRLVADMLRFTALIDFTDENMGGNQSGVGFRFKGWGSDNDIKNKERMVKKALMRRLRLLTYSWSIKENLNKPSRFRDKVKVFFTSESKLRDNLYDRVNDIEVLFTPNVPQSDEEVMKVITGMDAVVSEQTICEMASKLTGVPADEEMKRLKAESPINIGIDTAFDKTKVSEEVEEVDVNG